VSTIDELIERSRAPGRFVERSRFTLAQNKAVQKMREHALPDPQDYILELIRSAVFAQSSMISVDADECRVTVAWLGGDAVKERELEHLFDHLLMRQQTTEQRSVSHLAIAINTMLHLKPSRIVIESGDGCPDNTFRLEIDPSGESVFGACDEPMDGTYVSMILNEHPAWISGFLPAKPSRKELLKIEEHCKYCTVPILVNGSAPFGWQGGRPHLQGTPFDIDGRWGSMTLADKGGGRKFDIVVGGVIVQQTVLHSLAGLVKPKRTALLGGVICDDELRLTADHTKIARDRQFHLMLHSLQPKATELVRASRKRYSPPDLKPVPPAKVPRQASAPPEPPKPKRLPTTLPQLGHRPPIPREILLTIAKAGRIFCVRSQDVDDVLTAASVARLPYPVVVLSDEQLYSLRQAVPPKHPIVLTQPSDVDFALGSMKKGAAEQIGSTPFAHKGLRGTLHLTITLSGIEPGWDSTMGHDRAPMCITDGEQVVWAGSIPEIAIPCLHLRWELTSAKGWKHSFPPSPELWSALQQTIASSLGILNTILQTPHRRRTYEERRRDVLAAVLHTVAQPYFVSEDGEAQLMVHLLDARLSASRCTPLIDTETGPLSFDQFIALQGTEQLRTATHTRELERLDSLEDRFGAGHIRHPSLMSHRLSVVARPARKRGAPPIWTLLLGNDLPSNAMAKVWLGQCLSLQQPPQGMLPVDLNIPGVGAALVEKAPPTLDLRAGLGLLFELLILRLHSRPDSPEEGPQTLRARAMIRLAIAGLVDTDPEWRNQPLFEVGDENWSLGRMRDHPKFGVVPRGTPQHGDPHVLELTLDELRGIEGGVSLPPLPQPSRPKPSTQTQDPPQAPTTHRLPLRSDDTPSVWHSPDLSDWIVRVPVHIGDTTGWVGLRYPYDGTGSIMIQARGQLTPCVTGPAGLPCHGILRCKDKRQRSPQKHITDTAITQVYQALSDKLEGQKMPHNRRATAHRYATAWVLTEAQHTDKVTSPLGVRLSRLGEILDADGEEWGDLETWLRTPPARRPLIDYSPSGEQPTAAGLPHLNLNLADWLTQVVQAVTREPRLSVAVHCEISSMPRVPPTQWNRRDLELSARTLEWARDDRFALETRWMLAMALLREWIPSLRQNWVDVDYKTIRQDMMGRLMMTHSD
jgi:hypothetical protein